MLLMLEVSIELALEASAGINGGVVESAVAREADFLLFRVRLARPVEGDFLEDRFRLF